MDQRMALGDAATLRAVRAGAANPLIAVRKFFAALDLSRRDAR